MAANELKPCPFCGGKAEIILVGNSMTGYSKAVVRCHCCGMGRTYRTKGMCSDNIRNSIARKWNRRVNDGREQEKCLTNIKDAAVYKKGYKDGWNSCISDKADGWTVDYI